jgi:hypothetical protein
LIAWLITHALAISRTPVISVDLVLSDFADDVAELLQVNTAPTG